MEYELGIRLDRLEMAVGELQEAVFPDRFKEPKAKAAAADKKPESTSTEIEQGA